MISRGDFSNVELLDYVQCYDALRGHSSSTLQENITIATSTCLGEAEVSAHAQQLQDVIYRCANITENSKNVEVLGGIFTIQSDDECLQ